MSGYWPDRKVLAGGVGGIATWGVMQVALHYGFAITPDMQALISGGVGWLLAYLIPPAQRDILRRMNDQLVAIAAADPSIPVTKKP